VRLSLNIFGEEQLERELLRFSAYAGAPQPAFRQIAESMRLQITEQFETEGGRGSGGWEPDKPETLAAKAAKGLDPHVLRATGDLMASLTDQSGADHIEEISDSFMVFGSKVKYGRFHQTGTKNLPVRKPVDFTELDRKGFVRTLQRYVVNGTL
jgi:phage gpG-like protein